MCWSTDENENNFIQHFFSSVSVFDVRSRKYQEKKLLNKVVIFVKPLIVLTMSLLPFWALNMSVALLSMHGQRALGFHQKYLYLCSEGERRFFSVFETTRGWVINYRILIFGWTIPLTTTFYLTIQIIYLFVYLFFCNSQDINSQLSKLWDINSQLWEKSQNWEIKDAITFCAILFF